MVALEAARAILIEAGPQAVTLKAVSARIGRTHANLLHHFGSAAGLQKALAEHLTQTVCANIADAIRATRAGIAAPREIVDQAFDAFDKEGGGALVSWMLATGQEDAIEPFVRIIHDMIDALHEDEPVAHPQVSHEATLSIVLLALGQSLMGGPLATALNLSEQRARDIAERMLIDSLAQENIPAP
jgi:AcrR family transcriptional regulator